MTENDAHDEVFMRRALALAARARDCGEVPVGAVLVNDGQILAEGYNQPISSADPTAHAEIVAIREAARLLDNYRMPGTTLYVTLEPCTMCIGAVMHARIARLVYGAEEPRAGAVVSAFRLPESGQYNHKLTAQGGVLADVSAEMLRAFFADRRR